MLTNAEHLDRESYLKSRGQASLLGKYVISGLTDAAFGDLTEMNITFSSLFPDLDGAAKQANIWPTIQLMFPKPGDDAVAETHSLRIAP